jgi:hypothetical protein
MANITKTDNKFQFKERINKTQLSPLINNA